MRSMRMRALLKYFLSSLSIIKFMSASKVKKFGKAIGTILNSFRNRISVTNSHNFIDETIKLIDNLDIWRWQDFEFSSHFSIYNPNEFHGNIFGILLPSNLDIDCFISTSEERTEVEAVSNCKYGT